MINISHVDLELRFNQVKNRALHLGWANYTLERFPVPGNGTVTDGYRIINSLAKSRSSRRIPFGETYVTAREMLNFINGYDHAIHDMYRYKERGD